jgi:predicted HNH restriction endonuclease
MYEMKFKIGDRVRSLVFDSRGYNIGTTGTITRDGERFVMVKWDCPLRITGNEADANVKDLELLTETSELAELVRKANEGYRAVDEINSKYYGQVEIKVELGYWTDTYKRIQREFRIKPKPQPMFPELYIIGKRVIVDGESVTIGCQTFQADELFAALRGLYDSKTSATEISGGRRFKAYREGVKFEHQSPVAWTDIEQLLNALETYQQALKEAA